MAKRRRRKRRTSLGRAGDVRLHCTVGDGLMPGHFSREKGTGRWTYSGPKRYAPPDAATRPWRHPGTGKVLPGSFVDAHVTSAQVRRRLEWSRKKGMRATCNVVTDF